MEMGEVKRHCCLLSCYWGGLRRAVLYWPATTSEAVQAVASALQSMQAWLAVIVSCLLWRMRFACCLLVCMFVVWWTRGHMCRNVER
jgi:hypothetical protein